MGDLHASHATSRTSNAPTLLLRQQELRVLPRRRSPAVALAERAHEVRPRALDLAQADRKRLALLGFLLGDPPAEVDADHLDEPRARTAAALGEDALDQEVALGAEVAEGRRDEDADDGGWERSLPAAIL